MSQDPTTCSFIIFDSLLVLSKMSQKASVVSPFWRRFTAVPKFGLENDTKNISDTYASKMTVFDPKSAKSTKIRFNPIPLDLFWSIPGSPGKSPALSPGKKSIPPQTFF